MADTTLEHAFKLELKRVCCYLPCRLLVHVTACVRNLLLGVAIHVVAALLGAHGKS